MASGPSSSSATMAATGGEQKNYQFALSVLITLFFMWGFLTCLNDIIIPHLKSLFTLSYAQAMLIQFAFFMAYFIVSIPAGLMVKKVGYKNGIVIGLTIMAIACFMFIPSAKMQIYGMFLTAFFVLAAGITILQVAANPYVAVLGKAETASSRLTLAQAFNSLGTTIAPFLGAVVILSVAIKASDKLNASLKTAQDIAAYNHTIASSVQIPYIILGIILLALAVFFLIIKLPKLQGLETHHDHVAVDGEKKSAWAYKHLTLGAVGIFVYVGGEVAIGSFLVSYLSQDFIAGYSVAKAGGMVALYWGGAMIGRFIGSAVQKKIMPSKVLAFNAIAAIVLVIVSMMSFGHIAMYAILLVGLFNSVMFPTIFCLAIEDLGRHTNQGSGILCAAIVGGAIIPVVQGFLADKIGIHHCFIIPVLCYIYIAYYAVKGCKH
ncbi:MAG: sugar MFS transporter [Lentisphaerota bacterium]